MRNLFPLIALLAACMQSWTHSAEAAEIKLLCAVAMKPAMNQLAQGFEHSTGDNVVITYATAGVLRSKIEGGESFDVALLPTPFMDPLVGGKISSGNVPIIARSLISVGAHAGSPKPNISTIALFKNAMLAAKSVSYADPSKGGGSGIQVGRIFQALGIADAMKPKTKLVAGPESVDLVAKGEAEFALVNTPIIVAKSGVELVGPIPSELYDTKDFAFKIGLAANDQNVGAVRAFVQYLSEPGAAAIWKANGVEPGPG
jgi:molybdate transport system substrate-binding protein